MAVLRLAGAFAFVLSSACAPPDDVSRADVAPVSRATEDTKHTSVVRVLAFQADSVSVCTGTVLAARAVLTGAHCFDAPAERVEVRVDGAPPIAVKSWTPHPRFASDRSYDVAVLTLPAPIELAPVPLRAEPLSRAWVGRRVTIVGFGLAAEDEIARLDLPRRSAEARIARVGDAIVTAATAESPCHGDSGGPMLADDGDGEAQIAVARAIEPRADRQAACGDPALYVPIARVLDFLEPYRTEGPR